MATSKTGADSARRALELLFAFTQQRPVASVRQLAEAIDIPVPSVHRYVALLRDMGLIEEGARGQYHLTLRVEALSRAARQATSIVDVAEPLMRELSDEIDETVMLTRLVHGLPVCIHRIETTRRVRLSFEIGQHLPPLRGASARLLLGALTVGEQEKYVDQALSSGALPPIRSTEEFMEEVARDTQNGWAVSNQEIDEGVWAAAAPVTDAGRVVAAISAACPSFRLNEQQQSAIVDQVCRTAASISDALRA